MAFRRTPSDDVFDAAYIELVRSLLGTLASSIIMGAMFIATAWSFDRDFHDPLMIDIAIGGSVLAVIRIGILVILKSAAARHGLSMSLARSAERLFGSIYLAFALVVGAFGCRAFVTSPMDDKSTVVALVVGYGAGVAAGVSLRPWIAVPAMLLSVVPVIGACVWVEGSHFLLALILAVLMTAGIASILKRYREVAEKIAMGLRFASLARRDPLTALANRLGLEDAFIEAVKTNGGRDVVIHCFDLDRFKPVNDTYGHLVGDGLLQAVAGRLNRLVRSGDVAVRLGGDEFAVLQTAVEHDDESELLARRIARSLAEPYTIDGRQIRIGASVGSARGRDYGPDLARLLGAADDALYVVKKSRRTDRALAS